MRPVCAIVVLVLVLVTTVALADSGGGTVLRGNQQIALFPQQCNPGVGSSFTLQVYYDVTDANDQLSGLDVSVHFDSRRLDYQGCSNFLSAGDEYHAPYLLPDTSDEDNDPNTDTRLNMSWTSFVLRWPNLPLPVLLAELDFIVRQTADGGNTSDTSIKVSVFDHDARYGIQWNNTRVMILP